MDSNQEKMDANKASQEEILAEMNVIQRKMDAWLGGMKACRVAPEACEEKTGACLEKKEPSPEATEAVEKFQEVPEGSTDEETIGATEGRSEDLRPAVRCRGQLKTRTSQDGGSRQGCAAVVGRPTCRSAPAMRKGHVRRGPGKKCRGSGIRERGKVSGNGKRGRIVKRD
jgi:hypothetical protein